MAIAHLQASSPSGGGDCGASGPEPIEVGLDLDRGERDLLDLRRKGFLSSEQVAGIQQQFLLDAVSEIVARDGYRGLTVNRLTARAGISRLTLYQLYPGLDACLSAAVGRVHEQLKHAIGIGYDNASEDERWEHRVHDAVIEVLGFLDAQPIAARLCVVQAPCGPPHARAAHQALIADLAAALTRTAVGEPQERLPPRVVEGLIGGAWAMLYQQLATDDDGQLLGLAGEMTYLLCAPFRGPAVAEPLLHRRPAPPQHDWTSPTPVSAEGVRRRAEKAGKGRRKQILQYVKEHPGASNQQIGRYQGTSDSTTSRRLATLARDGLLHNRRRGTTNTWHITPHGQAILAT